ncbi:oligosaccharide flippase family protein [Vibrio splendidus]
MIYRLIKYAFSEGLAKLAPLLTALYAAKFLDPDGFGTYSLILTIYEIVVIAVSFNIQATTRIDFFKLEEVDFIKSKINHLIGSLFIFLLALVLYSIFGYLYYYEILILLISSLFRTISLFSLACYQCQRNENIYIKTNLVYVVFLAISVVILLNIDAGTMVFPIAVLLASTLQALFVIFPNLSKIKNSSKFYYSNINVNNVRQYLLTAAVFFPAAIGWWLKSGLDRFIIEYNYGVVSLGVFALIFQLTSIISMLVIILNLVFVPEINLLLKSRNVNKSISLIWSQVIIVTAFSLIIPIASSYLITNFYQESYHIGTNYIAPLSLGFYVQSLIMILTTILYYHDKGKIVAKLIFIIFSSQSIFSYIIAERINIELYVYISFSFNMILLFFVFKETRQCLKYR